MSEAYYASRELVRRLRRARAAVAAAEVVHLAAEQVVVVAFAGGTPPGRLKRVDWRIDPQLRDLVDQDPPEVAVIDQVELGEWTPRVERVPSPRATSSRSLDD